MFITWSALIILLSFISIRALSAEFGTIIASDAPNALSVVMAVLILLVSGTVQHYSLRHMHGDKLYNQYFVLLFLVTLSALAIALTDNLLILLLAWGTSNLFLIRLMIHKSAWGAAKAAGMLAFQTLGFGFVMLASAVYLLTSITHSFSITETIAQASILSSTKFNIALVFIALAAIAQSAQWPFHRWLLSSLNSPTPVSAFMHAGLVNGGGFLLARFAPLYLNHNALLDVLFIVGFVTAVLGTFWKLLQNDVKRMLACSTVGQMGFMIMQCGLGLFAAAVTHLCWHGLFKAFLFLNAGSAAQEKRHTLQERESSLGTFLLAMVVGVTGTLSFIYFSHINFTEANSQIVLIAFAFMTTTQLGHAMIKNGSHSTRYIMATLISMAGGSLYGISIHLLEIILAPLSLNLPQPLHVFQIIGMSLFMMIWFAMNLQAVAKMPITRNWRAIYVSALNSSQPGNKTITAIRNFYKY